MGRLRRTVHADITSEPLLSGCQRNGGLQSSIGCLWLPNLSFRLPSECLWLLNGSFGSLLPRPHHDHQAAEMDPQQTADPGRGACWARSVIKLASPDRYGRARGDGFRRPPVVTAVG